MFLRDESELTLDEFIEGLPRSDGRVSTSAVSVKLDADEPYIALGTETYPGTDDNIQLVAQRYDIPYPALKRWSKDIGLDFAETVVNTVVKGTEKDSIFVAQGERLIAAHSPQSMWVGPVDVVGAVAKVMPKSTEVLTGAYQPARGLRLDLAPPIRATTLWHGDPAVDDITGAGLRVEQNLAQSTTQFRQPSIVGLMYRLACTNGYEWAEPATLGQVTGTSVDEVLASVESLAQAYLGRAEETIAAFYDLREHEIEHPEQWLLRTMGETGVTRTVQNDVIRRVPEIEAEVVTEFDLVNLVSNEALNPAITQEATRRRLEQTAGGAITAHVARCARCQGKLVS